MRELRSVEVDGPDAAKGTSNIQHFPVAGSKRKNPPMRVASCRQPPLVTVSPGRELDAISITMRTPRSVGAPRRYGIVVPVMELTTPLWN
jgi:hypothetical protein